MSKAPVSKLLHNAVMPLVIFMFVWSAHFLWQGVFPRQDTGQWVSLADSVETSWRRRYIDSQDYYIGFSYALSLAFAAAALRRYRRRRLCQARNMAVGGMTLSGFFAVAGCYLLGCCGSPMLVVYISLFGASFMSFAKPLAAALTTIFIAAGWWWMNRLYNRAIKPPSLHECDCG
jgi:hypothetical protein